MRKFPKLLIKPNRLVELLVVALATAMVIILAYMKTHSNDPFIKYANRLETVYNKIFVASGQPVRLPIILIRHPEINAWTDGRSITITSGFMDNIDNDDELAAILGHELGHFMMNHLDTYNSLDQPDKEAQADKIGAFIMMRAGFDICKGREVFLKFINHYGNCAYCDSHPSNIYRYYELSLPQCGNSW